MISKWQTLQVLSLQICLDRTFKARLKILSWHLFLLNTVRWLMCCLIKLLCDGWKFFFYSKCHCLVNNLSFLSKALLPWSNNGKFRDRKLGRILCKHQDTSCRFIISIILFLLCHVSIYLSICSFSSLTRLQVWNISKLQISVHFPPNTSTCISLTRIHYLFSVLFFFF